MPDQIVKIDGTLKLEGAIKQRLPEYTISFLQKKDGQLTSSYYQPVSNITFGIFGVKKAIPMTGRIQNNVEYNSGPYGTDPAYWANAWVYLDGKDFKENNLVLNASAGMTLTSVKVKLIHSYLPYTAEGVFITNFDNKLEFQLGHPTEQITTIGADIGLEYTFTINGSTTMDNEIVFMSTYKPLEQLDVTFP